MPDNNDDITLEKLFGIYRKEVNTTDKESTESIVDAHLFALCKALIQCTCCDFVQVISSTQSERADRFKDKFKGVRKKNVPIETIEKVLNTVTKRMKSIQNAKSNESRKSPITVSRFWAKYKNLAQENIAMLIGLEVKDNSDKENTNNCEDNLQNFLYKELKYDKHDTSPLIDSNDSDVAVQFCLPIGAPPDSAGDTTYDDDLNTLGLIYDNLLSTVSIPIFCNPRTSQDDFYSFEMVWIGKPLPDKILEWMQSIPIFLMKTVAILEAQLAVEIERDEGEKMRNLEFAKAAYRIGHPLKDRTNLLGSPLNAIAFWIYKHKNILKHEDLGYLKQNIDRLYSTADLIAGFGHILNIISGALAEAGKGEEVFLKKPRWIDASDYNFKDNIEPFVKSINKNKTGDQYNIVINTPPKKTILISPWISNNGIMLRPFNMIYDEIFRETILNAKIHGKAENEMITVDVRKDTISINKESKDVLVFSNKNEEILKKNLDITNEWTQVSPSSKIGGGIMVLTTLLEVTNSGSVYLRSIGDLFEIALYLKGLKVC